MRRPWCNEPGFGIVDTDPVRATPAAVIAALLIAAAAAPAGAGQTTKYLIPDPGIGGYEIRDNAGRTTGYVIEDRGIGGFDVRDTAGRSKGFLIPDGAGGYRFDRLPGRNQDKRQ